MRSEGEGEVRLGVGHVGGRRFGHREERPIDLMVFIGHAKA